MLGFPVPFEKAQQGRDELHQHPGPLGYLLSAPELAVEGRLHASAMRSRYPRHSAKLAPVFALGARMQAGF